jgi:hypothetical protein
MQQLIFMIKQLSNKKILHLQIQKENMEVMQNKMEIIKKG